MRCSALTARCEAITLTQALPRWGTETLLSHEWLAPTGGSENVFEEMIQAFDGARRLCLWNDAPHRFSSVEETWLASTPLRRSKALALPFLSSALKRVDLNGVSRVVSSSHAFGHHLATRAVREGAVGFAYVHTPARYVWSAELDSRGDSLIGRAGSPVLRRLDRAHVDARVNYAANSGFVRDRIRRVWDVDATVIYPCVDVGLIQSQGDWRERLEPAELQVLDTVPAEYVLGASRLIPYKRMDLVIRTGELLGVPVVVAGDGPELARLKDLADGSSVPVIFVGRMSSPALYALYQRASLFVFPAVEDFGIMPVEAAAAGTPCLVNREGGAAESTAHLGSGEATDFTDELEWHAAAKRAWDRPMAHVSEAAKAFDAQAFRMRVQEWVSNA